MVSLPRDREPYSGGSEGAPPTPPPGGYRGARRIPLPAPTGAPAPGSPVGRPRPSPGGIAALAAAVLFALVLMGMWAAGATTAIYGVATLAVQLVLLIGVIAAVVTARGRRFGSIALAILLLVNVGTIGAASAVTRPPAATVAADPEADYWAAYLGIRDQYVDDILARASLEEVTRTGDELLEAIRERLTARYGYDWVRGVPGTTRHERNGYGGESMLVTYDSDNWATTEPITDHEQKLAVMGTIDEVILGYGFSDLYALNDPSDGFDPGTLERFYGSTDIRTQSVWEWVSVDGAGLIRLYATLTDLSNDDAGRFRATREGQVADSGEPLEGLRISIYVPEVLSDADVDEFLDRMADYPY